MMKLLLELSQSERIKHRLLAAQAAFVEAEDEFRSTISNDLHTIELVSLDADMLRGPGLKLTVVVKQKGSIKHPTVIRTRTFKREFYPMSETQLSVAGHDVTYPLDDDPADLVHDLLTDFEAWLYG